MEVLLREDVEYLGQTGDVIKVADGYARNYLLPKRLAVAVTPENLSRIRKEKERREKERSEKMKLLSDEAKKLDGKAVTISARADGEILYGSVGSAEIVAALGQEGFSVREEEIVLEEPIKQLGTFDVKVRFAPEIEASIRVWVVAGNA